MVYIRHLRKKLAELDSSEEFIETVWGVGYRIATNPAAELDDTADAHGAVGCNSSESGASQGTAALSAE